VTGRQRNGPGRCQCSRIPGAGLWAHAHSFYTVMYSTPETREMLACGAGLDERLSSFWPEGAGLGCPVATDLACPGRAGLTGAPGLL
jgi:hypothetical protein